MVFWRFVRTIACAVLLGGAVLAWPSHLDAIEKWPAHMLKKKAHPIVVTATPKHPAVGHVTLNGLDYNFSVTQNLSGPSGPEPEPVSFVGGPFAAWERDVTFTDQCEGDIEDDSGYSDGFTIILSLLDPSGNQLSPGTQSGSHYGVAASYTAPWTLVNPVEGVYHCHAEFYADGYDLGGGNDNGMTISYAIPTGETNTSTGAWAGPNLHWYVTVTPGSFGGRIVYETDGGNHVDTCKYDTQPIPFFNGVPPNIPPATLDSSSGYDDLIGMGDQAVQCYRANAPGCTLYKAPCQYETDQFMYIRVPGSSDVRYITNRLKDGVASTWVWSYRAGQSDSTPY